MSNAFPGAGRGSRGSVVILGADALLAALPATPTQLANACFAAGYDDVVPASMGDELLAVACLDQLAARDDGPTIACICPLVREQLRGANGLNNSAVRLVSPPVAAALYIRATSGETQPRITYVGDCPGGGHPSIDIHLSPAQFQALLADRGIVPGAQRPVTSSPTPRDRRRHYSLPGGVPAPQWLGSEGIGRTLVDLGELSTVDPAPPRTFVDLAPRLGCVCSGALAGGAAAEARGAVMALEPPRSPDEVVDHAIIVSVGDDPPSRTVPHAPTGDVPWPDFVAALAGVWSGGSPTPVSAVRPPSTSRPPVNRPRVPKRLGREGRVLPRAYATPQAHAGVSGRVRARAARWAEREAASRSPTLGHEPPPARTKSAADAAPYTRTVPASASRVTGVRQTRTALASTDRWLLFALALAGSVVVAVLTSVMTVRGLRAGPSAIASVPPRETVFVAAAPSPRVTASASTQASITTSPPPLPSGSVAVGSLRADSSAHPAAWDVKLGERTPVATARARARVPSHERERRGNAASEPSRQSVAARPSAPSAAVARATPPPSSRGVAPSLPGAYPASPQQAVVPPLTASVPAAPAASAAAAPPAPTRDSVAQSNAEVLTELREIRNEIESRKRHVDSLSRALDSLDKTPPASFRPPPSAQPPR
jgi:hypothetical protein